MIKVRPACTWLEAEVSVNEMQAADCVESAQQPQQQKITALNGKGELSDNEKTFKLKAENLKKKIRSLE